MDVRGFIKDIIQLIHTDETSKVRNCCLEQLLGITGPKDSLQLLLSHHDFICTVTSSLGNKDVSVLACLMLINLSAEEMGAKAILHINCQECSKVSGECVSCINNILDKKSASVDSYCMLLCNLSRTCAHANIVVERIVDHDMTVNKLIDAFCDLKYNNKRCNLNYLGPFFSNISQSPQAIEYLYKYAERLLPFTEYKQPDIRRGGIVGMLRNFSFNTEKHKWFLSREGLNILPGLLLPLAGPEEFEEDEMDKLPIELQYLDDTKERDEDPDIRRMLLETLLQFCSSKDGRYVLRDQNAYLILRELHKNEKDRQVAGLRECCRHSY